MVIYHARGLHVSVQDCRADKGKATLFHILAELVRNRAHRWNIPNRLSPILYRCAIYKTPDVIRETPHLLLNCQKGDCILARPIDLESISDDSRILQNLVELFVGVTSNFFYVEVVEEPSVIFTLS